MTDSKDEIEVTPGMVRAGASVLCGMELAFASEEYWAEKVYKAMVTSDSGGAAVAARCRDRPSSPS